MWKPPVEVQKLLKLPKSQCIFLMGKKVIDKLESLVNPEMPIPPFICNLTGINDQMVENAPKFRTCKKIIELSKDAVFVAHNVSFDYGMMRNELNSWI